MDRALAEAEAALARAVSDEIGERMEDVGRELEAIAEERLKQVLALGQDLMARFSRTTARAETALDGILEAERGLLQIEDRISRIARHLQRLVDLMAEVGAVESRLAEAARIEAQAGMRILRAEQQLSDRLQAAG
jgi:hypothetical protein